MIKDIENSLEWNRIVTLAKAEARSEPAKDLLEELKSPEKWAKTIEQAQILQQETQEIYSLLDRDSLWGPLTGLGNPETLLEKLNRRAILDVSELVFLRSWLYALDNWVQTPKDEIRGERFTKNLLSLPDPLQPLRILEKILTAEGELSEKASKKLASLFSELRSIKKEITSHLDNLLKTLSAKGVLQDAFIDVRDGRYVVPVKTSFQNEVEGIIHEASASRQTVFIEPKEVTVSNNRIRQKQNEITEEVQRILTETSKELAQFAPEFSMAFPIICYWDSVQAKARLGRQYAGKKISVSPDRTFNLTQTAHPLLWRSLEREKITRNTLEFGGECQVLLLTGPNTGGKTVLLKTIGLAAIAAKTGFLFPGADKLIVPFFDSIFVDMGDPQSIEAHLSSFSGHIERFKQTLTHVTENSLVLIDELNASTDPEEGAALGRAFLETLVNKGALVIATTHDPKLKALSFSDPRILNASMAFDENSQTPTYLVVMGVPGRSRALETAARLGLPDAVLRLAKTYLTKEHLELESLLAKLQNNVSAATSARKEAEQSLAEARRKETEWLSKTEASTNDALDRTKHRLKKITEQAQDEIRALVKKLDEMKNRKDIDKSRGRINEIFLEASQTAVGVIHEELPELKDKTKSTEAEQKDLQIGATVRIPKWKTTGSVLKIDGNKIKVSAGALQVSLDRSELEVAEPMISKLATQGKRKNIAAEKTEAPAPQIDIRGLRFDEAMAMLGQYLDQAYRSESYQEVTVIHGLGTGALREGTRKFLSKLPYIKNFRDGGTGKGGTGATIIEFEN